LPLTNRIADWPKQNGKDGEWDALYQAPFALKIIGSFRIAKQLLSLPNIHVYRGNDR
jgi:hypothetical protein